MLAASLLACGESHQAAPHDPSGERPGSPSTPLAVPAGPGDADVAEPGAEPAASRGAPEASTARDSGKAAAPAAAPGPTSAVATPPAAVQDPTPGQPVSSDAAVPPAGPDLTGWHVGVGHQGRHRLAWRLAGGGEVPRNVESELDIYLERDGAPVPGALIQVSGWMAEHQHGLVQTPIVDEVGQGHYRVSGMLFHMRGAWQLRFQVIADKIVESVTFELQF